MQAVFLTGFTGWLLLLLMMITTSLPFVLRRERFLVSIGMKGTYVLPYLQRLRLHYLLGYAITGIVVAHAWVPMSAGFGGQANFLGLYLGTGALFALIGQVLIGRTLQDLTVPGRRLLRNNHFGLMIGVFVLAIGHILLDSRTFHFFTR